jgi:SAM-dependent methyltransferase
VASEFEQNAAFHNELASHYDSHLAASPYNALARIAFTDLVSRYVPAGSTLLDFGCGTGLDAREYARRGYRVLAYDNSPGMVAELERRCAAEIASGAIVAWAGDYSQFVQRLPSADAVVANFAVLNSIRDLEPLFDAFAACLAPRGWVLVSLLNPIHWSKVKMPQWWRSIVRWPFAYKDIAHELGKHHKEAGIDFASLPFPTVDSPLFGLPVAQAALRVREVRGHECREVGSHMLFLTTIERDTFPDRPLEGPDGLQLFHSFCGARPYA